MHLLHNEDVDKAVAKEFLKLFQKPALKVCRRCSHEKKNNFGSLDTKDEKEIREIVEALKEKYDFTKEKCLLPEEL